MQAQMMVGGALIAGLGVTAGFAACSSQPQPAPLPPPRSATPLAAAASASSPTTVTSGGNDAAAIPLTEEQRLAGAAEAAQRCDDPVATIINRPDGGVVFNNAMSSADAGVIDRTQGVIDAINEKTGVYRCCFDALLREAPDKDAALMLRVTLAPDGAVTTVGIDPRRSTVEDPVAIACVIQVARATSYPASPSGKETIVEYPFLVAARQK